MRGARPTHPAVVRITHWLNAFAVVCMVLSGWAIYNASPLFGFRFPVWATLGGWLGGAIAWHFAAMWLLVGNGLVYVAYGLLTRRFGGALRPPRRGEIARDIGDAVRLRLHHAAGRYNALQRVAYLGVLLLGVLAVASGLALWKPVQLQTLAALLGGYEAARRVHFVVMAGIVGFVLGHVLLALLVPRTLLGMLTGRPLVPVEPEGDAA